MDPEHFEAYVHNTRIVPAAHLAIDKDQREDRTDRDLGRIGLAAVISLCAGASLALGLLRTVTVLSHGTSLCAARHSSRKSTTPIASVDAPALSTVHFEAVVTRPAVSPAAPASIIWATAWFSK